MLKHLPHINKTMKGMGVLAASHQPVLRFAGQYWPLTMLTVYALYRRLNKRRKDGSLTTFTALTDAGLILSPMGVIALISMASNKQAPPAPKIAPQQQQALPAPVSGFSGPVPPPAFFATRPPHEADAAIPAPAEEIVTAPGSPTPTAASGGPFDSFLS